MRNFDGLANAQGKTLGAELCARCGEAEIEWIDTYCQECWEYYTAEFWWNEVAIAESIGESIPAPTQRACFPGSRKGEEDAPPLSLEASPGNTASLGETYAPSNGDRSGDGYGDG